MYLPEIRITKQKNRTFYRKKCFKNFYKLTIKIIKCKLKRAFWKWLERSSFVGEKRRKMSRRGGKSAITLSMQTIDILHFPLIQVQILLTFLLNTLRTFVPLVLKIVIKWINNATKHAPTLNTWSIVRAVDLQGARLYALHL